MTKIAGVADGRWSTGSAFGDYDGDGFQDLIVANYVDFKLNDLPGFGSSPTCKYRGIDVQCGPRGLKGAGDSLFHNNGDGTFTDVTKKMGVDDPSGFYGMQTVWSDFGGKGKLDAYIADDSTPNLFYRNEGDKFAEMGLESGTAVSGDGSEQGSMGAAVGDYNHTGRFSIFVTNFADEYNTLYRNDGEYNFTGRFIRRQSRADFAPVRSVGEQGFSILIMTAGSIYWSSTVTSIRRFPNFCPARNIASRKF